MAKLKRLTQLKAVVLCSAMLFSGGVFAQSEKPSEKSVIVMTKAELSSFLNTIADARRAKNKERDNKRQKEDLANLRLKYQQSSQFGGNGYENASNQQILQELRYLNQRIDNLNGGNNAVPNGSSDKTTIIMPGNAASNPYIGSNGTNTTTLIPTNKKKIEALQFKIDSLKSVESRLVIGSKDNSLMDSLGAVKNRLNEVRRKMDSLERKMTSANKIKTKKSKDSDSFFKQQVYFDNNSETLRTEYFKYVQDLTQILLQYPEAKIMLEGWASPLGETNYNKQLSMRRAESVENAFVNNRIDASRILTSFRGEDKTSSDQHARRVDMSIIVR